MASSSRGAWVTTSSAGPSTQAADSYRTTGEKISARITQGLQAIHSSSAGLGDGLTDVLLHILDLSEGVESADGEVELLREKVLDVADAIADSARYYNASSAKNLNLKLVDLKKLLDQIQDYLDKKLPKGVKKIALYRDQLLQMQSFNSRLTDKMLALQLKAILSIHYAQEARTLGVRDISVQAAFPNSLPDSELLPPPPTFFFGRDGELTTLIDILSSPAPVHVCLRGAPGIGKSALALQLLNDEQVAATFGQSRFFVPLDTADTALDVWECIARCLGVVGRDLKRQVLATLNAVGKAVMVLDSAEVPWEAADRRGVEDVFRHLTRSGKLSIIVTLRGQEFPRGVAWVEPISYHLQPLDEQASSALLYAIAKDMAPDCEPLLPELDGVPLAIELTAHAVAGGLDGDTLRSQLNEGRTQILDRSGPTQDRGTSIDFSVRLSLDSPRMAKYSDAKDLLGLLAFLPDGIEADVLEEALNGVMPDVRTMIRILCQTSLVYELQREDRRVLKCLGPVRAFASSNIGCKRALRIPLVNYYLDLAEDAGQVFRDGQEAYKRVKPELGNLDATLGLAWKSDGIPLEVILQGVYNLGVFTAFSNLGSIRTLELVASRAVPFSEEHPDLKEEKLLFAKCVGVLGEIFLLREQYEKAKGYFQIAIDLFQSSSWAAPAPEESPDVANGDGYLPPVYHGRTEEVGASDSSQGAGTSGRPELSLGSAGETPMKTRIQHAKKRRHETEIGTGLASCIRGLGDAHLFLEEHRDSLAYYENATRFFEESGDVLGTANCLQGCGAVYLRLSQSNRFNAASEGQTALDFFSKALSLFAEVGDPLGQAHCNQGMAEAEQGITPFRRPDGPKSAYTNALEFFVAAGAHLDEAYCLVTMGEGQQVARSYLAAQTSYERALELFREANDTCGQAICLKGLADAFWAREKDPNELVLAELFYAEAAAIFREDEQTKLQEGACLTRLAEMHMGQGLATQALDECRSACELIPLNSMNSEQVIRSRIALARALLDTNDVAQAKIAFSNALDRAITSGRTDDEAKIHLLITRLSGAPDMEHAPSDRPTSTAPPSPDEPPTTHASARQFLEVPPSPLNDAQRENTSASPTPSPPSPATTSMSVLPSPSSVSSTPSTTGRFSKIFGGRKQGTDPRRHQASTPVDLPASGQLLGVPSPPTGVSRSRSPSLSRGSEAGSLLTSPSSLHSHSPSVSSTPSAHKRATSKVFGTWKESFRGPRHHHTTSDSGAALQQSGRAIDRPPSRGLESTPSSAVLPTSPEADFTTPPSGPFTVSAFMAPMPSHSPQPSTSSAPSLSIDERQSKILGPMKNLFGKGKHRRE